jgi:hypothetical protein
MPVRTRDNRAMGVAMMDLIEGAGTLFDWGLQDRFRLSEKDFAFVRDDLQALYADWLVVGDHLRLVMGSQLPINTDGPLLFSPKELMGTNHEKER